MKPTLAAAKMLNAMGAMTDRAIQAHARTPQGRAHLQSALDSLTKSIAETRPLLEEMDKIRERIARALNPGELHA